MINLFKELGKKSIFDILYENDIQIDDFYKNLIEKHNILEMTVKRAVTSSINENDLKKYYINENLSISDIANLLRVSYSAINRVIKKFNMTKSNEMINMSMKKKFIEKYGVDNPAKNKVIQQKIKQTNIQKYGCEYTLSNSCVREKAKQTNIQKYGVDNPQKSKIFRDELKQKRIEKLYKGMPHTNNNFYTIFDSLETAQNYFQNNYRGKTIHEVADDLNYSYSRMKNLIREFDLGKYLNLKPSISKYEKEIVEIFLQYIPNLKIQLNDQKILGGKEIDIYLPEYNLGIEFNGSYWHSEEYKDKKYHQEKSLLAEEKGIFIYHIFEYEWVNQDKKKKIISQLLNLLNCNSNKVYARKCKIKLVSAKDKAIFLKENHLQGNDKSSINLGLYYNDDLVSIMTFCVPRFNKKYTWELSRFCSKAGYNIIGAANKLFQYFVNNYLQQEETVITYNDITKTKGTVYEKMGFILNNRTEPNYVWWYNEDIYKSRYQTMMINEAEIMHNDGYVRIYDCGNKVWIYKKN